eukprot:6458318-Amphidinium_carterae.1
MPENCGKRGRQIVDALGEACVSLALRFVGILACARFWMTFELRVMWRNSTTSSRRLPFSLLATTHDVLSTELPMQDSRSDPTIPFNNPPRQNQIAFTLYFLTYVICFGFVKVMPLSLALLWAEC